MPKAEINLQDLPDVPLWRICDAAAISGISEWKFLNGAASGDIPCEILKVGRTRYVRSAQFIRWLRPTAAPPASPPAPDCNDLF